MANKKASAKLTFTSTKIANVGDLLLGEEGQDWEIDELHLVSKSKDNTEKVVCKYFFEGGKWVLKCTKE